MNRATLDAFADRADDLNELAQRLLADVRAAMPLVGCEDDVSRKVEDVVSSLDRANLHVHTALIGLMAAAEMRVAA